MKHLFTVRISIEKFPEYFFEITKEFDFPFKILPGDKIIVDEIFCEVEKVYLDLNDNQYCIFMKAYDSIPICDSSSMVAPTLLYEMIELEEYGWKTTDYFFGEEYEESNFSKIESLEEVCKSTSLENLKIFFIKAKMNYE